MSVAYEAGFASGERDSFHDRRRGKTQFHANPRGEYQRGYIDGYTPRSLEWAARTTDPTRKPYWWRDSEETA